MTDEGATDRNWPIYLMAAGVLAIATRFINSEGNALVDWSKVIFGLLLIAYGGYQLVRKRRTRME